MNINYRQIKSNQLNSKPWTPQWRSQPKNADSKKISGAKVYDFRRITLFCLEKRLSKD